VDFLKTEGNATLWAPRSSAAGAAWPGQGGYFFLAEFFTIRANDDSTLLDTLAEYMHQAFQSLIDWSITGSWFATGNPRSRLPRTRAARARHADQSR
jgi:hypothetical protein